jgi:poly [ADP-ribose] polymerase
LRTQAEAHSSQYELQVENIYDVYKPSEKLRFSPFEKNLHNKFLLWQGFKTQSLPSVLRNGIRMPSKEAAQTGYMFGKGIYFYDSVSKALVHTEGSKLKQLTQGQSTKAYLVLSEVALGDMHKAYAAHQFKRSAPMYCHSVYGIGLFKPNKIGIRDICQPGPDFAPN